MSAPSGEEVAAVLLRSLPAEVAEQLLNRLGKEPAQRVRARLQNLTAAQVPTEQVQSAIKEFFDLQRIAERMPVNAPPAGEYSPVAPKPAVAVNVDPVTALKQLDLSRLVRVLQEEQAPAVSIIMSCLDIEVATEVMKRLPQSLRPDVAIRLTQPGSRNVALIESLARAVVQKSEKLVDSAPELTADDRIKNLAAMLRELPRVDRKSILDALQISDPDASARVGALLFQFEDLMRVDDRGLQTVLVELDMKTLAMALKGAAETIASKITANISSRARDMLNEEMALLGATPGSRVQEARNKIVAVLKQFEEEGKIVLMEEE